MKVRKMFNLLLSLTLVLSMLSLSIPLNAKADEVSGQSCTQQNAFETNRYVGVDQFNNLYVYIVDNGVIFDPINGGHGGTIKKMDGNTGEISTVATNIGEISAFTVDPSGKIYIAQESNNEYFIKEITKEAQRIIATTGDGSAMVSNLGTDGEGNIYYKDSSSASLIKLDSSGNKTPMSDFLQIHRITNDVNGNVYVWYRYWDNGSRYDVAKIDDKGNVTKYSLANQTSDYGEYVTVMAADNNGNVYLPNKNGSSTLKMKPDGTVSNEFTGLLNEYDGSIAVDTNGNFYVVDEKRYEGTVYKSTIKKISSDGSVKIVGEQSLSSEPTIKTPLQNQTVTEGSQVNFSVGVEGCGDYTYQWYKDNQPIQGETNKTLVLDNATSSDAGVYKVLVSYGANNVESTATLTVERAITPSITNTTTSEDTQSSNGLVIERNDADGINVTHFKITDIVGGTLFKNDGTMPINNGDFITIYDGNAGLKFTPSQDANSIVGDTFSFKAQAAFDTTGAGLSDPTTAVITVNEVNDAPTAVDDVLTNIEENSGELTIPFTTLLSNDSQGPENEDSQEILLTDVEKIEGGDVRIVGANVIFTPTDNYSGNASFLYTIEDNGTTSENENPLSSQATVSFQVDARAYVPTITSTVTSEDTQSMNGLEVSPNLEGATITHYKISGITGGQLYKNDGTTIIPEGSFITKSEGGAGLKFTPDANQYGTTGFGFNVQAAPGTDGTRLSDLVPVNITVQEVNDSPVAENDIVQDIQEDAGAQIIPFAQLLSNDTTGVENESDQKLKIVSVEDAIGGTVQIIDSNIVFTPQSNYYGNASFQYSIEDNGTTNGDLDAKSDSATVSFEIKPIADTPSVIGTTVVEDTMSENGLVITKNAVDGSEVTQFKINEIVGGTLYKNDGTTVINDGEFITISEGQAGLKYKPNSDAFGETGFSFTVKAILDTNGNRLSEGTTAVITVTEVNDSPIVEDDSLDKVAYGIEKVNITFSKVIENDLAGPVNESDQSLIVNEVSNPIGGTVSIVDGQIQFIPDPQFIGKASFTYQVSDNGTTNGESDSKTASGNVEFEIYDATAPTITLYGENPLYLLMNQEYFEAGYSVYDDVDGDLTNELVVTGSILFDQLGISNLKYNVSDRSGNAATEMTRKVTVVSNELKTLTTSSGDLDPVFDPKVENYTLAVSNSVTSLDVSVATLDPTATLTINGLAVLENEIPSNLLEVGPNTITLIVTAQGGSTKTYTIEVTRDYGTPDKPNVIADDILNVIKDADDKMEYSTNEGDSWTSYNPTQIPKFPGSQLVWVRVKAVKGKNYASEAAILTFTPNPSKGGSSSTEIITVDVDGENGKNLNKTPIKRTTEANGTVKDDVTMPENIAKEIVTNAKNSGNDTARIIIPDQKDIVTETNVKVPKKSLTELKIGNLNLEIYTENATISIPKSSLTDINNDLYFRLVPIKKDSERLEVEERAKKEDVVKEALGDGTIKVVGRPMTIETNITSRKVNLILPLVGVKLPSDSNDREEFLNNLGIFIEHSDGDRVLVRPEPVEYKEGLQGLKFTIEKFSTFTIVNIDNLDQYFGQNTHKPYIKGYTDGTFRPTSFVKRAQMAAMLARNLSDETVLSAKTDYMDISTSYWGYEEIMKAKQAGIMTGSNGNIFKAEESVSRAQMATIAYRWMKQECKKDSNAYESCKSLANTAHTNYVDVESNHWAIEAINFMKAAHVMEGYEDKNFRPDEKLTRAQAVKVLNRLFKRGPINGDLTSTFNDVEKDHWAFREIEEAGRTHSFSINESHIEYIRK